MVYCARQNFNKSTAPSIESKPRLAIVSSHKICCALAYYADALMDFLEPAFDVEIIDIKSSELLRKEGKNCTLASEKHVDQICQKLKTFDVVNIHLEIGLYGLTADLLLPRILKLCQASGRLILTIHTIDCKGTTGHAPIYQEIMKCLKNRPASNPYHLIAHLPQERGLIETVFGIKNISDFPLIYLTNERRTFFTQNTNPPNWKRQFGFQENDIVMGMFGILSAHKNYLHALRTLNLLPSHYKLLIVGEAHHMNVKEWKVDPVIQEMIDYLDQHPALADRVVFTGKRDDAKYYDDLAHIDFVLLPSYEVAQSGSATLSNALELGRPVLKSNTWNALGYEIYFPDCFERFDVGNYYETKYKIVNFDQNKLKNLAEKRSLFSEIQLRQLYLDIFTAMRESKPVELSLNIPFAKLNSLKEVNLVRTLVKLMPKPVKSAIKKLILRDI